MKICINCIQPDTRPGIYFNEEGVCGACLWENEKNKIDWNVRENELQEIADEAKLKTTSNYDCVIGVSGGKDSTFQAINSREKLGLRCLLVNCEPAGLTEIGRHNIENLKNLGFDVITIRPNPKKLKTLMQYDFFNYLNPIKITEFALYSSTYIIAEKFDIPLIIQGENPGLTLGASLSGVGTGSNALKANELETLSKGIEEYLTIDGIVTKDLFLYQYVQSILEKKGIKGIWLQYYLKEWSQHGNAEFSKKYGLLWRPDNFDPNSIGTYVPYAALDTDWHQVNQMLKCIKFGFGQCVDSACYDLRENRITKDKAIDLVLKYDGKCDNKFINKFCDYFEISNDKFWTTVEKFRGPMWTKKENGEWTNEYHNKLKEIK